MNDIMTIYEGANNTIGLLDFFLGDMLGGAILVMVCMFALRLMVRAMADSWVGQRNGGFVASAAEMVALIFIIGNAYKNPGIITVVLAWSAAIFRQFIIYFKGGV